MCECESEQNAPRILIFSSVGCRPAHLTRVRPPRCITLLRGDEQSAGPTGARVASKRGRVVSSKVTGRYLGRMGHRGERLGSQSWIPNHVLGDARQPRGEMKELWWEEWPLRRRDRSIPNWDPRTHGYTYTHVCGCTRVNHLDAKKKGKLNLKKIREWEY